MSSGTLHVDICDSGITFRQTNENVLNILHEKELLGKTFYEVVKSHLPLNINLPTSLGPLVESRFRSLCTSVDSQYRKAKGRVKDEFLKKERSLKIGLRDGSSLKATEDLSIKDILIRALKEEVERMEGATRKAVGELQESIRAFEMKCLHLEQENKNLSSKAEKCRAPLNSGKLVGEGSRSNDQRKLFSVGSAIVQALEGILESYGVHLCQLVVADIQGLLHKITLSETGNISVARNVKEQYHGRGRASYDILSSPDKRSVREVTALLDNHFVSNTFWEKLSASVPDLPSLRVINSYRDKLDSKSTVFKTPGEHPGAQVSFVEELQSAIEQFAEEKDVTIGELICQPILVKIEGDGCVISKQTNWTTLSFLLIDDKQKLQSHRLHRLLAVVEISENYFLIRESLRDLIDEVNGVVKKGSVTVQGHEVPVSICLQSDFTFSPLVQGMESASSKYPCPFC